MFSVRVTEAERLQLEAARSSGTTQPGGVPRSLGAWLVWRALTRSGSTGATSAENGALERVLPAPAIARVVPELHAGEVVPGCGERIILDLCSGSGAWSEPYARAGYPVIRVDLPDDVRTYVAPPGVWGILAAPPCTEFSLAKNGHVRDLVTGMACVNACMRIILQARPRWWALENPTGLLGHFLGTPRDVWEPCDFGDPWTKRTAVWGDYQLPTRGPFVAPSSGWSMALHGARTPSGFARAFFAANP